MGRSKSKRKRRQQTVLSGIPPSLPSIIKAYRLSDKAAGVGFDWDSAQDVWNKVKEEISEFEVEIANKNQTNAELEFGDMLFALINAGRHHGINADTALELVNQKFTRRFNYIEQSAKDQGRSIKDLTLNEMENLWQEAKKLEKK